MGQFTKSLFRCLLAVLGVFIAMKRPFSASFFRNDHFLVILVAEGVSSRQGPFFISNFYKVGGDLLLVGHIKNLMVKMGSLRVF